MRGFEDVVIGWNGAEYTVKARAIMPLIATVEDIISGQSGVPAVALLMGERGGPTVSRLCMAFGAILRHAGAKVEDEEIYLSVQDELLAGSGEALTAMSSACDKLLAVISPPVSQKMEDAAGALFEPDKDPVDDLKKKD